MDKGGEVFMYQLPSVIDGGLLDRGRGEWHKFPTSGIQRKPLNKEMQVLAIRDSVSMHGKRKS